jgi:hypothetical protein
MNVADPKIFPIFSSALEPELVICRNASLGTHDQLFKAVEEILCLGLGGALHRGDSGCPQRRFGK